jgi:mRNA interferase MazF
MRRGDVYVVDYDPARKSEANKARPAVVVSSNAANRTVERSGEGVVTVVPLTSNVGRIYTFQVLVPAGVSGLTADSKIQAEQIRAVSTRRLKQRIGSLPPATMAELDRALRVHLAL